MNFKWRAYLYCLLTAAIFYLLIGQNSFLVGFNSADDANWFFTMGHGLVQGKLPYRDLFEQKGPILYYIFGFACLFNNPAFVIWLLEIFCVSWFLYCSYLICRKWLSEFLCLICIAILSLTIFSTECHLVSGGTVEEFCLPIFGYGLLCWLEFLLENQPFGKKRCLMLGCGLGCLFWIKYTMLYFFIAPLVIWLIMNLCRRQYKVIIGGIGWMMLGFMIISLIAVFPFLCCGAFGDLWIVYFYDNLILYNSQLDLWLNLTRYFGMGALAVCFMLVGIVWFAVIYWRRKAGWLLLIAFLVNWVLLYLSKGFAYYFIELLPYCILGIALPIKLLTRWLKFPANCFWLNCLISLGCLGLCLPLAYTFREIGRQPEDYTPVAVARIIKNYECETNAKASLFCYKINDYGFYNAVGQVPTVKYYSRNIFTEDSFPAMYESFRNTVREQSCTFVVTKREIWQNEFEFLSQYYQPYGPDFLFQYRYCEPYYYRNFEFVLLIKR